MQLNELMSDAVVAMTSLINSFGFCNRPQLQRILMFHWQICPSSCLLTLQLSADTAVGVGLHKLLPLSSEHVSSGM